MGGGVRAVPWLPGRFRELEYQPLNFVCFLSLCGICGARLKKLKYG